MVNSNNVTRKFTMKEKLASLGPGFVIVGSFIGPGTVTSCTLAGATYGFTLFWCVVFSVIAVIVMQGMAARIGIITQEGLAENMKHDFADRPLLRNILCGQRTDRCSDKNHGSDLRSYRSDRSPLCR